MVKIIPRFFIPVIAAAALLALGGCFGGKQLHEKDYQRYWCDKNHGRLEYRLDDSTRVDCLTRDYAVEVEFAHKWAEAVGQSLYYANMTGKLPGIVLIMQNKNDDRFLKRLRRIAAENGIRIWTVKPDEAE